MLTFGVAPTLVLKGPRLFGLEKEQPDDLHNIFYRSVRYSIYYNRKKNSTLQFKVLYDFGQGRIEN